MEEFKEIFFFAVSLIIAAFIISFAALFGTTSRQMAEVRNSEIIAAENIMTARTYLAYDNQKVQGIDVIALLRENAKTGELQIYIDKNANGTSMTMSSTNYTNTTWNLSSLFQSIKSDDFYTAILVYGDDNPASAGYTAASNSMITGIKFTQL